MNMYKVTVTAEFQIEAESPEKARNLLGTFSKEAEWVGYDDDTVDLEFLYKLEDES